MAFSARHFSFRGSCLGTHCPRGSILAGSFGGWSLRTVRSRAGAPERVEPVTRLSRVEISQKTLDSGESSYES